MTFCRGGQVAAGASGAERRGEERGAAVGQRLIPAAAHGHRAASECCFKFNNKNKQTAPR